MALRWFVCALMTAALAVGVVAADVDVVKIDTGLIRGTHNVTLNSRSFKGIPFGIANRFAAPSPAAPWSGVLNCTKFGPGCVSTHHNPDTAPVQSENCLNLDVYAPLSAPPAGGFPVMFWIYGGGFQEGFNAGAFGLYDGAFVAGKHEVVIVAVNYRLGAFGFTVIDDIKGNAGILDQRLGMQWVQQNIGAFGGDANRVTIWGESAGAMSVGLHLISPGSQGLFHAAIMESNPASILYKDTKHATVLGIDFCAQLSCNTSATTCNTTCLREEPTTAQITEAWKKSADNAIIYILSNWGHLLDGFLDYMPTIDGDVIPSQVIAALQAGKYNTSIPIMIGTNRNEMATFLYDVTIPKFPVQPWLGIELWAMFGAENAQTIQQYYAQFNFTDDLQALSHVMTDYMFTCPSEQFAAAARAHGTPAFVYQYDHVFSDGTLFSKFGLPSICSKEVCHATELPLVFHLTELHNSQINMTLTPEEIQLSDWMGSYWTSFATFHDPNQGGSVPVTWPTYDIESRPRLALNVTVYTDNTVELCSMWDKVGYNL